MKNLLWSIPLLLLATSSCSGLGGPVAGPVADVSNLDLHTEPLEFGAAYEVDFAAIQKDEIKGWSKDAAAERIPGNYTETTNDGVTTMIWDEEESGVTLQIKDGKVIQIEGPDMVTVWKEGAVNVE